MISAQNASTSADSRRDCVFLLHGLARSASSMQELADSLRPDYATFNIDYPSRDMPIRQLADRVVGQDIVARHSAECLHMNFVTHSMGGILVRQYFADHQPANMGRVVMLGPPNHGSEVVDHLKDWSLFKMVNGPAGEQLGTDSSSVPNSLSSEPWYEVGIIAGDRSINWINSIMIAGPDDGKVSVASSKLKGMKDHLILHTTHPMMMTNDSVIFQVKHFLKEGSFQR